MTAMSDRLAEIEARLGEATPRPWRRYPEALLGASLFVFRDGDAAKHPPVARCETNADADLIAHAPTDLRDLLAVAKAVKRIVEEEAGSPGSHDCTPRCSCVYASLRSALANLEGGA